MAPMENKIELYGGMLPCGRHALRVLLNRIWSRVLRRGLARAGSGFNVDFTARILGGSQVTVGRDFYAGRGLKLVVTNPGKIADLVRIGDRVGLNEFVTLTAHDRVCIGDNVLIGSRVYLGNIGHGNYRGAGQSHPNLAPNDRPFFGSGPMIIESNVWLGEGVIVPSGVTIGRGSIVGAGAVVTKDIPPHVIAVGNPARVVKEFDPVSGQWRPALAASRGGFDPLIPSAAAASSS